MQKTPTFLIALAAFVVATASPVLASDLSLNSTIVLSPTSPTSYSPSIGTTFTVPISVKNASSSSADFFFAINKETSERNASLTVNNIECSIALSIKDSSGTELPSLSEVQSNVINFSSIKHNVKKGNTLTVKASIKAAAGYYGPDGSYAITVIFSCYRIPASGDPVLQFSVPVMVTFIVPSRATMTLSDGLLDFGQLIEGESLGTTITIEANRPWDLYLQSQRGGCLQHAVDRYSKVWYTLTMEGEDFGNLVNPTICYSNDVFWGQWFGYNSTLSMAVTIGEVPFEAEPGIYTDNIWLTIMTR